MSYTAMQNRQTIPQIRDRLHELAVQLGCQELHDLAEATRRRAPVRRAPRTRRGLDRNLVARIHAYAERAPDASYMEIAEALHTNIGRVSEALAGVRGEV